MTVRSLVLGSIVLMFGACSSAPAPNDNATGPTGTSSTPSELPTTTSTTFPTDTGFGGTANQDPDHWLHVTELGSWAMGPAGGPYDTMSGTLTLQEYVDELDIDEGPTCFVSWSLTGGPGMSLCSGCDFAFVVDFTQTSGDISTCQSTEMPDEGSDWRMGYNPSDSKVYLDVGNTGVWVAWYDATKIGDNLDLSFITAWPIYVDEDMR